MEVRSAATKAEDELVALHNLSPRSQHKLAAKVSALAELLVEKGIMTQEEFQERVGLKQSIIDNKIRSEIRSKKKDKFAS